jgi:hypothetical protein
VAAYVHQLAAATGWGYNEIMDEVPLSLGLQIIDAQCLKEGVMRERIDVNQQTESAEEIIDKAFKSIGHGD